MAKKTVTTPSRSKHGLIVVRNVDLAVWEEFKQLAKDQVPEVKLGPFLTETMRERIEREKLRR